MCVGESKVVNVVTEPVDLQLTTNTKKSLLTASKDSSGTSYTLTGVSPHSDQDTLTFEYNSCTSEKFDIYVLPEAVEDIPGKINRYTQFSFLQDTCPDYPNQLTTREHDIDGCSGPGIQDLESNIVETALLQNFEYYVSLPVWGAPVANVPWGQGGTQTLACNAHDVCYQECGSDRSVCDAALTQTALATCDVGYPPVCPAHLTNEQCIEFAEERDDCRSAVEIMYDKILGPVGFHAWTQRQTQHCSCCKAP